MKILLWWIAISVIAALFMVLLIKGASMEQSRCSTCETSLAMARGLELPPHPPKVHYSTKMGNVEATAQGFAGWDALLSRTLSKDEISAIEVVWSEGNYDLQTFIDHLPPDVEAYFKTVHLARPE